MANRRIKLAVRRSDFTALSLACPDYQGAGSRTKRESKVELASS